jgi:hypothetical protein
MPPLARRAALPCAIAVLALVATSATARAQTVWTQEAIGRPLTMPQGSFLAGFNASVAPSGGELFETNPVVLVAAVGVTDELELGVNYTFTLADFEPWGGLRGGVGYAILRGAVGGRLEVIARAETGYDFESDNLAPFTIGPQIQLNLTSQLAVVSPATWLNVALAETENEGQSPIFLNLPVGVLYQATPQIFLQLDTLLASIEIADSTTTVFGADSVPLTLTAGFTPIRTIDLGITVADDLRDAGDTLALGVFFRFYGGV